MNIKFIALAVALTTVNFISIENSFAGFDVVNSYEYKGDSSSLIRTSPSTQNTRMPDSIFIENGVQYRMVKVPVTNTSGSGGLLSSRSVAVSQPMLLAQNTAGVSTQHASSMTTNSLGTTTASKPVTLNKTVVLNNDDINKLIKSFNNVTFIGQPTADIFTIMPYSGNEKKLQKGIETLAAGKYLVAIYPSVARAAGNKPVSWSKGVIWVNALDKTLDGYGLKAVIDVNGGTLYVSERKNDDKSISNIKPVVPVALANTMPSTALTPTSPFEVDKTHKTVATTAAKTAPVTPVLPLSGSTPTPVVNVQPIIMSSWSAQVGSTLKSTVQQWSDKQGWRLIWQTDKDYNITAPFTVNGKDTGDVGFMDAMKKAFSLYDKAKYPFQVKAYPEQRLMYVTSKGKDNDA